MKKKAENYPNEIFCDFFFEIIIGLLMFIVRALTHKSLYVQLLNSHRMFCEI